MSIKQAIEALDGLLKAHAIPSSICAERPAYEAAVAALAALRSMPQGEPVDKQQEIDTITELNHAQWLALGKASLLVAACNRLSGEAEEFDFDDGLGRGAPQAYWDEFEDALEQAAEAIDVANKTIHQDHIATPHTAPLSDACEWSLEDEDNGIWQSSCGELWSFIDGGPKENRVSFCHHCGKPAIVRAAAALAGESQG